VYLGLPLIGARSPAGGLEEFLRLATEDAVRNVYGPAVLGAARELPAALEVIRREHGTAHGPIRLLGGSAGAAVAALVLAQAQLPITSAVLANRVSSRRCRRRTPRRSMPPPSHGSRSTYASRHDRRERVRARRAAGA
jgi:hypothetical protein